jgi:predicted ester cyclase
LYDEEIQLHGYSPEPMDKAAVRSFYQGIWAALDQPCLEIHQVVEEGDTLAVQAVMSGRHVGELAGVQATGITVHQPVMTFLRFADGRCLQRWSIADFPAVMTQIGVDQPS